MISRDHAGHPIAVWFFCSSMEMLEESNPDFQSASIPLGPTPQNVDGLLNPVHTSSTDSSMQEHMDRLQPGEMLPPLGRSAEMLDLSRDIDVSFPTFSFC